MKTCIKSQSFGELRLGQKISPHLQRHEQPFRRTAGGGAGRQTAAFGRGQRAPPRNRVVLQKNITNPLIILPQTYDEKAAVWHVFVVRTRERERFQQYLTDKGVQTIIHYPTPPHKQEAYAEWNDRSYPISEEIHRTIISLPISPVMTGAEIKEIVRIVNEYR